MSHAAPLASSTVPVASSATTSEAAARARAPAREVLRELAADAGEHRRDLGVRLAAVGRVELHHAEALVAGGERERDGGDQAGAQRFVAARHVALAGEGGDPGGAPERPHAAGQALAGRERQLRRLRRERGHRLARARRLEDRDAAQRRPVGARPPDGAEAPAERLAERAQHARAQLVGLEAGRDVVGDRLLGVEQLVRAADAAAHARLLDLAREDVRELARVRHRRHARRQPADQRREVARAHARGHGDERQVRIGELDERERLARRHRLSPLPAVEHDLPAAPLQGAGQAFGAADRDAADLPAGLGQDALEQCGLARGDVHEQDTD
jgi:hypothetical protein